MAARELRAAPRRLLLLMATVAVGVAALVAINSFTDNLQDSVRQQARALLGADLALVSRQAFSPRVEALLDTLSRRSAPVPRDQLCRHGVRPSDRRHPAGAGGGGGGRLPLLRRDPHRARGRPGASCRAGATSWWIHRSSRRSAPGSAIRSRWARAASSSPARSRARPSDAGVRFALRAPDLHPCPLSRRDRTAGVRGAGRARGVPGAARQRVGPGAGRPISARVCAPNGSGFAPSPTISATSTTFSPSSPAISAWSP